MSPKPSVGAFRQVWKAVKQLNPSEVSKEAERKITLAIVGTDAEMDAVMAWLTQGEGVGKAGGMVQRFNLSVVHGLDKPAKHCDLAICAFGCSPEDLGLPPYRVFSWDADDPEKTVEAVLDEDRLSGIHLALAHWFRAFRKQMNMRIIRSTSLENAAFVASTAVGNVIPNPLAPLASIVEAAGDTVVLTANQARMLFRLAATNDKPVGFKELLPQIGTIVAAAFGWRALARQLVSKIPLGGGLVAKSAVGYAGTWTIGEGIVLYFTTGRKMTRKETNERFQEIMGEARQIASQLANSAVQKVRLISRQTGITQ